MSYMALPKITIIIAYGNNNNNSYHVYETDHTSSEDKEDVLLRASFLFSEDA